LRTSGTVSAHSEKGPSEREGALTIPIRPEVKKRYPFDWKELSRVIRFERVQGRCEQCGRPHCKLISRLGDGRWFDPDAACWRDGQGRVVDWVVWRDYLKNGISFTWVYTAAAHLNHDIADNRGKNLKALCQRCDLLHDR